jgi:predicted phosphodiesterase
MEHIPNENSKEPPRQHSDYTKLSRWQILNHFKTEYTKAKPGNRIGQFFRRYIWTWLYHTIKSRFGPKHIYPGYPDGESGIYKLSNSSFQNSGEISIAIVADWATDTPEACRVAEKIRGHNPDYTIHMGDTYYVGTPVEIKSNFLNPDSPWVRGEQGSFALLGNHEMYARGIAYFDDLLPSLGRKKDGHFEGQKTGYFCLENEHWRILGLDTGYNSIGIPFLEFLPFLKPDCRLHEKQIAWLKETVKLGDPADQRALLFLTHHQFITAFHESEYKLPAQQLSELIGRERSVLWIWGHEHKFSIYQKAAIDKTVSVYGRCIGHGGMPVELKSVEFKPSSSKAGTGKLVMVDKRPCTDPGDSGLGFNGYAVLRLQESQLSIEYYDTHRHLIKENWTAGTEGSLHGNIHVNPESGLKHEEGKIWEDAVQ